MELEVEVYKIEMRTIKYQVEVHGQNENTKNDCFLVALIESLHHLLIITISDNDGVIANGKGGGRVGSGNHDERRIWQHSQFVLKVQGWRWDGLNKHRTGRGLYFVLNVHRLQLMIFLCLLCPAV